MTDTCKDVLLRSTVEAAVSEEGMAVGDVRQVSEDFVCDLNPGHYLTDFEGDDYLVTVFLAGPGYYVISLATVLKLEKVVQ